MILQPNMDFAEKVGRLISGHLDISTLNTYRSSFLAIVKYFLS